MRNVRKLTLALLCKRGACYTGLRYFKRKYGQSTDVTVAKVYNATLENNGWALWLACSVFSYDATARFRRLVYKHDDVERGGMYHIKLAHLKAEAKFFVELWNKEMRLKRKRRRK